MRYSATEKLEIIELVGQSNLPQRRCLASLGVPRQTCLSVWDRIFSTHIPEPAAGQLGMVIGIDEFRADEEQRLDRLLTQPFGRGG